MKRTKREKERGSGRVQKEKWYGRNIENKHDPKTKTKTGERMGGRIMPEHRQVDGKQSSESGLQFRLRTGRGGEREGRMMCWHVAK